jgi:hypothetical protein
LIYLEFSSAIWAELMCIFLSFRTTLSTIQYT